MRPRGARKFAVAHYFQYLYAVKLIKTYAYEQLCISRPGDNRRNGSHHVAEDVGAVYAPLAVGGYGRRLCGGVLFPKFRAAHHPRRRGLRHLVGRRHSARHGCGHGGIQADARPSGRHRIVAHRRRSGGCQPVLKDVGPLTVAVCVAKGRVSRCN